MMKAVYAGCQRGGGIEVSIVIPCLNEAATVGNCLRKAQQWIRETGTAAEIIVADNGSTDGSQRIAEELGAVVVPVAERGYGAALASGFRTARGTFVIMGDADDSYSFLELTPFLEKLREGYDLVMGCRFPSRGGRIVAGAMPWKNRWIGNPALSGLGRLFFRIGVADFHCGLRAFRKEAVMQMNLKTTGMEFASEMVVKAALMRMRIAEVPVTLYPAGRQRPPHLKPWRDGWRHLRFMLLYSPHWLFLYPGALLSLLGAVFLLTLLPGPLVLGSVRFDTNTLMVSSMAILLGAQLVFFYLFTKIFAASEGLLPMPNAAQRFLSVFSLEAGIILGIALAVSGIGILWQTTMGWAMQGFGPLSYPDSLRKVVPSVTLVILGVQILFSSFFMSILGLPRK